LAFFAENLIDFGVKFQAKEIAQFLKNNASEVILRNIGLDEIIDNVISS
jgi:hypothetical protein